MAINPNWHQTRKKGLFQFVIVNGILLFGLPLAIAITVFRFYFFYPLTDSLRDYLISSGTWMGFVLQALISGVLYGIIIWFVNERSYGSKIEFDIEKKES